MEDVADNLFNPDPYYQQGGDMVRVGGMDYTCDPTESMSNRISSMTLDDGRLIAPDKSYRVAGWASVNPQEGKAVSDVLAAYMRREKTIKVKRSNRVTLRGVAENPGAAKQE
jgi:sulfur-oxidizing protein SoxB